jgi:hypothetical protein
MEWATRSCLVKPYKKVFSYESHGAARCVLARRSLVTGHCQQSRWNSFYTSTLVGSDIQSGSVCWPDFNFFFFFFFFLLPPDFNIKILLKYCFFIIINNILEQ